MVRTRVKSRFDRSIVIPIFSPSLFSSFLSIYSRQPYEYQRRSVICAEIKWRETIIFYAKRFTMDRGELEISCDEKYDDFFFFSFVFLHLWFLSRISNTLPISLSTQECNYSQYSNSFWNNFPMNIKKISRLILNKKKKMPNR